MENNRSYFMRRAAQERSAANHASGDPARKAHLEMARRYRDLVGRWRKSAAVVDADKAPI
jgi:hypothetical protein